MMLRVGDKRVNAHREYITSVMPSLLTIYQHRVLVFALPQGKTCSYLAEQVKVSNKK